VYPTPATPKAGVGVVRVRSAGALGVTLFDGADAGPVPTPFVAVTVNEYTSPFVNPDTTNGLPPPDTT